MICKYYTILYASSACYLWGSWTHPPRVPRNSCVSVRLPLTRSSLCIRCDVRYVSGINSEVYKYYHPIVTRSSEMVLSAPIEDAEHKSQR